VQEREFERIGNVNPIPSKWFCSISNRLAMLPQSLHGTSIFLVSKGARQWSQLWNELGIARENFNKKIDKHGRLRCKPATSDSERKYRLAPLVPAQ
jgi:hypothetical protein